MDIDILKYNEIIALHASKNVAYFWIQSQKNSIFKGNTHFAIKKKFLELENKNLWIFSVCAPQYVMRPSDTEHVPLHSKSQCKNIARASGGCKWYAPTKLGGTNGKDPNL